MAYNEFRKLTGAREVDRKEFAKTVERHNAICAITPEQHREFWSFIDRIDAPEA